LQPFGKDRWDLEGSLNDILAGDGEGWFLQQREFTWQGEPKKTSRYHIFSPAGFLDSSMHHRYFWVYATRYHSGVGAASTAAAGRSGRIMCQGDQHLYGFRTQVFSFGRSTNNKKGGNRELYGEVFGSKEWQGKWATPLPFSPNAMVWADNALFVAGPNGNIEESLQAFCGELGESLWAVDPHTGAKSSELPLDVMPVFDGLIAGGGRLYLSATDGSVRCYSGETK
jgi:outer membrane protein assembly factor BamB